MPLMVDIVRMGGPGWWDVMMRMRAPGLWAVMRMRAPGWWDVMRMGGPGWWDVMRMRALGGGM